MMEKGQSGEDLKGEDAYRLCLWVPVDIERKRQTFAI